MSSHANLSAAADDRKARLAKLKGIKRKHPTDEVAQPDPEQAKSPSQEEQTSTTHLSGRNYDAETRGPKLGFEAPPTLGLEKPTLEQQAAEISLETKQRAAQEAEEDKGIDLFKLQPKKPNWDLKRNLEQKMEILNVRTDNAIAKLVRERINGAQKTASKTSGNDADGDAAGMDGVALVEGLRVREREEEEDERREREEEAAVGV